MKGVNNPVWTTQKAQSFDSPPPPPHCHTPWHKHAPPPTHPPTQTEPWPLGPSADLQKGIQLLLHILVLILQWLMDGFEWAVLGDECFILQGQLLVEVLQGLVVMSQRHVPTADFLLPLDQQVMLRFQVGQLGLEVWLLRCQGRTPWLQGGVLHLNRQRGKINLHSSTAGWCSPLKNTVRQNLSTHLDYRVVFFTWGDSEAKLIYTPWLQGGVLHLRRQQGKINLHTLILGWCSPPEWSVRPHLYALCIEVWPLPPAIWAYVDWGTHSHTVLLSPLPAPFTHTHTHTFFGGAGGSNITLLRTDIK